MRHIEFIAPVAAVRGNLSGKQNLLYPTKNNSAWDIPSDKRNYATNYAPRYVGAKRSRDGRTYFSVKQRSSVSMSDAMRKQQAVLGGSKAIYDALIHNPLTIGRMQALYHESPERNSYGWSMYKWAYYQISGQVGSKIAGIRIIGKLNGQTPLVVQNPWIGTSVVGAVIITISDEILAKFWMQLANNPVQFTVDGAIGLARPGDDFDDVMNSNYNVLGISIVDSKAKIGALFISFDHNGTKYVGNDDTTITDYPTTSFYLSETAGADWTGA